MANPIRHYRAWSPSENRQLRELARKKTPPRVMSLKLGRTPDAIRAQAAKEGISLPAFRDMKRRRKK
jgi:hypothetical protein